MPVTDTYRRVALADIHVDRATRQRSAIDVEADGLLDSVKRFGVLNPVIVTEAMVLVAGERRLAASAAAGLPDIPIRLTSELTPIELQIIELDENIKRSDLPWRDYVQAVSRLHKLHVGLTPEWTLAETANSIGLAQGTVSAMLRVAADIDAPSIANAAHYREAYNILLRKDDRATADAVSEIMELGSAVVDTPAKQAEVLAKPKILPVEQSVLQADFLKWAREYSGPKFNFIHCDFPYGIEAFSGPQMRRGGSEYIDDEETYWMLCTSLAKHLDRLMAHSGHLMFWCSGNIEIQANTLDHFRELAPSLTFQRFPLYWVKSDNVGVLPDPKRGPRHIVETALIASREDRQIIKAVSNAYSAPTDKAHHPSTKPEPVLRYFFQMFVDQHSRVLDPTCGSGSALRAAESLGAVHVLGLEKSPEYVAAARSALRQFRVLRSVSK